MINKFIIFGPPGVGKGTLAGLVAAKYDLEHISTGNIFREQINKATPLGIQLKQIVESGQYVSDDITNQIVKNKLAELAQANRGFILDGYPRTTDQLHFLFSIIPADQFRAWILEAPESIILKRLSGRRFCPNCKATYHVDFQPSAKGEKCEKCDTITLQRADDQPEAIIKRLQVYQSQTEQLIQSLRDLKIAQVVDSSGNPESMLTNLEKVEDFGA